MVIMASDDLGQEKMVIGNAISICVNGDDQEEIKSYFSKLSQGAKNVKPLKKEFFGLYGDLTDKFGIQWLFQSSLQS